MSVLDDIEQELFEGLDENDEEENREQGDNDGNEETANVSTSELAKQAATAKAKRAISRHPRPKLDGDRLCGERGIPILPQLFKNVSFKGKGHEKEDLDSLMNILEHWAHRLFPKYKFDDVIAKIEKLGTKKSVQTCIKKIRLDMPVQFGDVKEIDSEGEDDDTVDVSESHPERDSVNQNTLFDDLLSNYESAPPTEIRPPSPVFNASSQASTSMELTEDQMMRIEQSRRIAEERRRSKLQQQKVEDELSEMEAAFSTPPPSHQINDPLETEKHGENEEIKTLENTDFMFDFIEKNDQNMQ